MLVSSLTSFGSAGGEALQGHSKVLAILHRGAKRAILTRVKEGIYFRYRLTNEIYYFYVIRGFFGRRESQLGKGNVKYAFVYEFLQSQWNARPIYLVYVATYFCTHFYAVANMQRI